MASWLGHEMYVTNKTVFLGKTNKCLKVLLRAQCWKLIVKVMLVVIVVQ
jgi:hypothetical protein